MRPPAEYIKEKIGALSAKSDLDDKQKQLLEKLNSLDKLNQEFSEDLPTLARKLYFHDFVKYFDVISILVNAKRYEEARVLAIVKMVPLEEYLYSERRFKNIWPRFIASHRKRWKYTFLVNTPADVWNLKGLVLDGKITPESCIKYPYAFNFCVKMLPENESKYEGLFKMVIECKSFNKHQRRNIIQFLLRFKNKIAMDYTVPELFKLYVTTGAKIFKSMLPENAVNSLEFNVFDFVREAVRMGRDRLVHELQNNPRVFEPNSKGVYPIEYIMAQKRFFKGVRSNKVDMHWRHAFAAWHQDDEHWKRDNLRMLRRRLKHIQIESDDDADYFYVTMQHITSLTAKLHSLRKAVQKIGNSGGVSSFPLSSLPIDIIHVISKHLSLTSVMALTLTCKSVNQMINTSGEIFWKRSLAITCPMSEFDTESDWKTVAVQESRTSYNWIIGRSKQIKTSIPFWDCKGLDDNWGVFNAPHISGGTTSFNNTSLGTRIHALFNCHTHEITPQYELRLNSSHQTMFLESNQFEPPIIVAYSRLLPDLIVQFGDELIIKQPVPEGIVSYGVVGVNTNTIFFNKYLWDIEADDSIIMTFDLQVIHDPLNHSLYHKQLQTVLLSTQEKLFMLDTRSGQTIVHDDFQLQTFDLIDENTIGFINNGIGTVDLRMMRKEFICEYRSNGRNLKPIYIREQSGLVNGRSNRVIFTRYDGAVMQWDFRERTLERITYMTGTPVAMNSRQLVVKNTKDDVELFDFS